MVGQEVVFRYWGKAHVPHGWGDEPPQCPFQPIAAPCFRSMYARILRNFNKAWNGLNGTLPLLSPVIRPASPNPLLARRALPILSLWHWPTSIATLPIHTSHKANRVF
jgi:hypothetical protein